MKYGNGLSVDEFEEVLTLYLSDVNRTEKNARIKKGDERLDSMSREQIIHVINTSPEFLFKLNKDVFQDTDVVKLAVGKDGKIFKRLPKFCKENSSIVLSASNDENIGPYLSKEQWEDVDLVASLLMNNDKVIQNVIVPSDIDNNSYFKSIIQNIEKMDVDRSFKFQSIFNIFAELSEDKRSDIELFDIFYQKLRLIGLSVEDSRYKLNEDCLLLMADKSLYQNEYYQKKYMVKPNVTVMRWEVLENIFKDEKSKDLAIYLSGFSKKVVFESKFYDLYDQETLVKQKYYSRGSKINENILEYLNYNGIKKNTVMRLIEEEPGDVIFYVLKNNTWKNNWKTKQEFMDDAMRLVENVIVEQGVESWSLDYTLGKLGELTKKSGLEDINMYRVIGIAPHAFKFFNKGIRKDDNLVRFAIEKVSYNKNHVTNWDLLSDDDLLQYDVGTYDYVIKSRNWFTQEAMQKDPALYKLRALKFIAEIEKIPFIRELVKEDREFGVKILHVYKNEVGGGENVMFFDEKDLNDIGFMKNVLDGEPGIYRYLSEKRQEIPELVDIMIEKGLGVIGKCRTDLLGEVGIRRMFSFRGNSRVSDMISFGISKELFLDMISTNKNIDPIACSVKLFNENLFNTKEAVFKLIEDGYCFTFNSVNGLSDSLKKDDAFMFELMEKSKRVWSNDESPLKGFLMNKGIQDVWADVYGDNPVAAVIENPGYIENLMIRYEEIKMQEDLNKLTLKQDSSILDTNENAVSILPVKKVRKF